MKYDARACLFNMDTGCVELTLQDGRKISIDCTGVDCADQSLVLAAFRPQDLLFHHRYIDHMEVVVVNFAA